MVGTIRACGAVRGQATGATGRWTTWHEAVAVDRVNWNIRMAAAAMTAAGVVSAARPVRGGTIGRQKKAHGKAGGRSQDEAHGQFLAKM
jgi:hypothetical protein